MNEIDGILKKFKNTAFLCKANEEYRHIVCESTVDLVRIDISIPKREIIVSTPKEYRWLYKNDMEELERFLTTNFRGYRISFRYYG